MTYSDRIIKRKAKNKLQCRGCGKAVFKDQEIIEIPPQKKEVILLCMSCCKQIGEMALSNNEEDELTPGPISVYDVMMTMEEYKCSAFEAEKYLRTGERPVSFFPTT